MFLEPSEAANQSFALSACSKRPSSQSETANSEEQNAVGYRPTGTGLHDDRRGDELPLYWLPNGILSVQPTVCVRHFQAEERIHRIVTRLYRNKSKLYSKYIQNIYISEYSNHIVRYSKENI